MSSWHSYPSIFALGHRAIKDLFLDSVVVQEKVDGSQISFGIFDGELKIKSKGKELILDAPEKMFKRAVDYIVSIKDKLHDGWTYRGEYLEKEKHNTIKYDRVPKNNIILFDINPSEEAYCAIGNVQFEADRLGFDVVPTFYSGMIDSIDKVKELMDRESILGGSKIEGFVFKNYSRFGQDKKVLMGKYVSEAFKEVHNKEWKKNNNKDIIQILIEELKTEARYEKAIQHVKERGELDNSPKDIGKLITEIKTDIEKECIDYIKERLYNNFKDNIFRAVTSDFAYWYKDRLAKEQF